MDPQQPDAPLPPLEPPAPGPLPPVRKAPFPTWKQGFVLLLGGGALFLSACFGCLSTLGAHGNTTNDALFTLLAIVALIGGAACAIGGVFIFIRMVSALFASKPKPKT